jgi:hypothetical protein
MYVQGGNVSRQAACISLLSRIDNSQKAAKSRSAMA